LHMEDIPGDERLELGGGWSFARRWMGREAKLKENGRPWMTILFAYDESLML
jgi:hypothetical protein